MCQYGKISITLYKGGKSQVQYSVYRVIPYMFKYTYVCGEEHKITFRHVQEIISGNS